MTEAVVEERSASRGEPPVKSTRQLVNLALLYASKSGAVVVGLLILPLFNKWLGPEQFGVVALIFSLQAFLIVLDFGMSTIVGRDLAVANTSLNHQFVTWRAAEVAISAGYALLLLPAFIGGMLVKGPLSPTATMLCVGLFWALTLQNIGQSALLAKQHYVAAATIQVFGVLARNGLSAAALFWIAPTLTCFVSVQASVAITQMLVTRWQCNRVLIGSAHQLDVPELKARVRHLAKLGQPLMMFGLAGAAVMQLDKVIVSALMSPRELAPYFLAMTLCLTPLSVLASPIAQFFQPKLVQAISADDAARTRRTLLRFVQGLTIFALVPTAAIWLFRDSIITLWLHGSGDVATVSSYSEVLLPGIALGALGYIPFIMLTSRQDYHFQARYSVALTVITLLATCIAARFHSLMAICLIYACYHSASTIGSWYRSTRLDPLLGRCAGTSARHALVAVLFVFGMTYGLSNING